MTETVEVQREVPVEKTGETLLVADLPRTVRVDELMKGDVFEVPEQRGLVLQFASCEPYPKVIGWVLVTFVEPEEIPMLMKPQEPVIPRRMLRRWPGVPCMLCGERGDVQHDMVEHGRLLRRVCGRCTG
ncbi:hypothetical protein AB0A05_26915 [Streptomyces sp. NPDC046374]|uniref:hypothetical protein n=1 Tax=Streptomyces sp. NPDC046374 TaxID=3154917 RepID=UPI0033CCB738